MKRLENLTEMQKNVVRGQLYDEVLELLTLGILEYPAKTQEQKNFLFESHTAEQKDTEEFNEWLRTSYIVLFKKEINQTVDMVMSDSWYDDEGNLIKNIDVH